MYVHEYDEEAINILEHILYVMEKITLWFIEDDLENSDEPINFDQDCDYCDI